MKIVVGHDDYVGDWVSKQLGHLWIPGGGRALGWADEDGTLVAGVVFSQFDGINVVLECAATPKTRWLDRRGLWAIFNYCFEQLGVVRVTAMAAENNNKSIKLLESAGFEYETRLERAAPQGYAMLIYRMFKEDCRWLGRAKKVS